MIEIKKTAYYAAAAVVLALLAWAVAPNRITPDAFLDQGDKFFPEFTDPNVATTLEVIDFDETSGSARPFKVTFQGNRWTIPSHHGYPADGKDRLAQTASGVIDIRKDDFRTNNVADHEACGVVDPLAETVVAAGGRGSRITIKGKEGQTLADFIIGKDVPGREGFRFVRVPDQNRVYAARVDLDISTNFTDWIEADLLEVAASDMIVLELKDYSINERTFSLEQRSNTVLTRSGDSWSAGSRTMTVDSAKLSAYLKALAELNIVGVRPKPAGLSAGLTTESSDGKLSQADRISLQNKGFYFSRDGQLLANEGEVRVHSSDGVIYTLRFGEVLFGSGLAITAGLSAGSPMKQEGGADNRYLLIAADFNNNHFKRPDGPTSTEFADKADSLWTDTDRANKALQDEVDDWQRKVGAGRARALTLNDRFSEWYYVISAESYQKIQPDSKKLQAE